MRVLITLLAFVAFSCGDEKEGVNDPTLNKDDDTVPSWMTAVAEIDLNENLEFQKPNECKSRFTTNFDQVFIKVNPLEKSPNLTLQISADRTLANVPSFSRVKSLNEETVAKCDGLSRMLIPSLFSDQGRLVRNEVTLSLNFGKDSLSEIKPDAALDLMPSSVRLQVIHQSTRENTENKKANVVLRTINVDGKIACDQPFKASCLPGRAKGVCGAFQIMPPKTKCTMEFANVNAEIERGKSLALSFGGVMDFNYYDAKKSAYMQIDHIDFK